MKHYSIIAIRERPKELDLKFQNRISVLHEKPERYVEEVNNKLTGTAAKVANCDSLKDYAH